jgi:signal transduction histidine kinase
MQISRTVINEVLKRGEGVVTSNAQTDTRFANHASVMRYSLRSIMCVPLRVRGEIIGVVYVDNSAKSGLFDTHDGEMLEALAIQAAVAIENARLYTQTDAALAQRVAELETLQQIDRELNTGLDLERILELTLGWAVRETGAETGWIAIRSGDSSVMSIVAGLGKGSSFKYSGDEINRESFDEILESGSGKFRSHLPIPIKREDETIAFIGVVKYGPFSSSARPNLNRLVEHAAVAIENTRLYRSVEAANLAKSQFISVVSHELRMPMTAISGYADLLRQETAGAINEKQARYLDTIRSNVARMEVLVSDLSDISRIETGRLRITTQSVPLQTYIRETVAGLKPQFDEKNQTLNLDLHPELLMVIADPARLVQVLTNLIGNANKYTAVGGRVSVQASPAGHVARVVVSDSGIGISTADQADLFSQFFRSDDPLVREQQGWGLGLHVARRLVQLMGGEIGFESTLGKGSTFWFTLPIETDENGEP